MALLKPNYLPYSNKWPVLNFFNALVNDPYLAKDFEQANTGGRLETLRFFGLDSVHLPLFTPSGGVNRPLSEDDIRKIFEEALKEILDDMPRNFW